MENIDWSIVYMCRSLGAIRWVNDRSTLHLLFLDSMSTSALAVFRTPSSGTWFLTWWHFADQFHVKKIMKCTRQHDAHFAEKQLIDVHMQGLVGWRTVRTTMFKYGRWTRFSYCSANYGFTLIACFCRCSLFSFYFIGPGVDQAVLVWTLWRRPRACSADLRNSVRLVEWIVLCERR
jgi:hypothetical protein